MHLEARSKALTGKQDRTQRGTALFVNSGKQKEGYMYMKTFFKYLIGAVLLLCSGCTGIEIGGKAWITRVDERQESQATHNVPLKCYLWESCGKPVDNSK